MALRKPEKQAAPDKGAGIDNSRSGRHWIVEFLTRPSGIVAALVVVIGLLSAVWTLGGQVKGAFSSHGATPDSLAIVDQAVTSGRP